MTRKTWFSYIVLFASILLLAWSYLQWKDKLSSFHADTESTKKIEENVENNKSKSEMTEPQDELERLTELISNQDQEVQDIFIKKFEDEEDLNFLIVGSAAMEDGNPGYGERLENALKKTYGDFMQVTKFPFDGTSAQFMNVGISELDLSTGYDIVLFEPFTLENNGLVADEDERIHIQQFCDEFSSHIEDAVMILHPPQPVHQANFYPAQVDSLQSFAEDNDIPYINHWTEWRDSDSDEFLEYVTEEGAPNNEGADIWANALIDYFIAEKTEEE